MSPDTVQRKPTAVVLRATSSHGPLALEIPVEVLSSPAETIHQLAAKKAVQDLEEDRGWIYDAKDEAGILVKDKFPSCFDDLVKREAVRLGEKFQVAGKWCSFVAVSANDEENTCKQEGIEVSDTDQDLIDYSDEEFHVVGRSSTSIQADEKRARNAGASARFRKRSKISNASPQLQLNTPTSKTSGRKSSLSPSSAGMASAPSLAYSPTSPGFSPTSSVFSPTSPQHLPRMQTMKARSAGAPDPFYSRSSEATGSDGYVAAQQQQAQQEVHQLTQQIEAIRQASQSYQQMEVQADSFRASQPTRGKSSLFFGERAAPQSPFAQPSVLNPFGSATNSQGGLFGSSQSPVNASGRSGLFGSAPAAPATSTHARLYQPAVGRGTSSLFGGTTGYQNVQPASAVTFGPASHSQPEYRAVTTHQSRQYYGPTNQGFMAQFSQQPAPQAQEAQALGRSSQVYWISKSAGEKVLALIALQDFEGSWPYDNKEVGQIMGFEISKCPNMGDQKTWVTLVVVCFLEQKMSSEEGTWGLVVEKARGWLEGIGNMDLENLENNAREFVMKY